MRMSAGRPAAEPWALGVKVCTCRLYVKSLHQRLIMLSMSRLHEDLGKDRSVFLLRHYRRSQKTHPNSLPIIKLVAGSFRQ